MDILSSTASPCIQTVTEAIREWLLGQGRAPEYLPLQQLFALCHAGLVTRNIVCAPHPQTDLGQPVVASPLSSALVRLLDGCLSAAAQLPDPALRRAAARNVVAAFCRSALREAHLRGRQRRGSAGAPQGAPRAAATAAPRAAGGLDLPSGADALDSEFLDTAFAVLAAVAPRHPLLVSELQVMEVAWGQADGAGAHDKQAAAGIARAQRGTAAAEEGAGAGSGAGAEGDLGLREASEGTFLTRKGSGSGGDSAVASVPDAEALADFFLSADFQCRLAAGQLVYGTLPSYDDGGVQPQQQRCGEHPEATEAAGEASEGGQHPQKAAAAVVEELCEVPALAELCGAAALADIWPDLVGWVAEGGAGEAARRLGQLMGSHRDAEVTAGAGTAAAMIYDDLDFDFRMGGAGGGNGDGDPDGCGCGLPDGGVESGGATAEQRAASRRCCGLLAAALLHRPQELMRALPPQLMCVLAVRSTAVRQAMLAGMAASLESLPPTPTLAPANPGMGGRAVEPRCGGMVAVVSELAQWFRVMGGCELGELMQRHLMHYG